MDALAWFENTEEPSTLEGEWLDRFSGIRGVSDPSDTLRSEETTDVERFI